MDGATHSRAKTRIVASAGNRAPPSSSSEAVERKWSSGSSKWWSTSVAPLTLKVSPTRCAIAGPGFWGRAISDAMGGERDDATRDDAINVAAGRGRPRARRASRGASARRAARRGQETTEEARRFEANMHPNDARGDV